MSIHHDSLLFMVLYREALDRLCVRLNMYLVAKIIWLTFLAHPVHSCACMSLCAVQRVLLQTVTSVQVVSASVLHAVLATIAVQQRRA